jgi:hypothetical protein
VQTAPEEIPVEARVWDYDELSPPAQRELRSAVTGEEAGRIPEAGAEAVESGDIVVFTEYYLIR